MTDWAELSGLSEEELRTVDLSALRLANGERLVDMPGWDPDRRVLVLSEASITPPYKRPGYVEPRSPAPHPVRNVARRLVGLAKGLLRRRAR